MNKTLRMGFALATTASLILTVSSGVYGGYGASGLVRGNVQSHGCSE